MILCNYRSSCQSRHSYARRKIYRHQCNYLPLSCLL